MYTEIPNPPSSIIKIDSKCNTPSTCDSFANYKQAALFWFRFGLKVIPIAPGSKKTAIQWNPWLDGLSEEKIEDYWTKHPDHEVGFIVSDDIMVFDADSPESIAAIAEIEKALDITPNLVVKTKKGEHHFYKRAKGTFAKSDSHSTEQFPNRLDVKTGRSMVILTPSTGKEIEICEADNASDLTEINQEVIDAVFRHNGRPAPRPQEPILLPHITPENQRQIFVRLNALLEILDPDCGYEDWLHIIMAIYHETGGSDEGFDLANAFSSKGKKYKGVSDIRAKWNSLKSNSEISITIGTLNKMVEAKGFDWMEICSNAEDKFVPRGHSSVPVIDESKPTHNPFDKYSLMGMSDEIEKNVVEAVPILGQIALMGQATIIYAAPNTGKTLITLGLLLESIKMGWVNPSMVYYLNMDDTGKGLLEKLRIAEEYGLHMLSEGYNNFTANEFLIILTSMIENNQAQGVVIILDTLKKFVNLMDKTSSSSFTKIIRRFVVKGGTLVALAHTNKNPGLNGKPVYGGTSDIIDDCDCAFTLATVSKEGNEKVVEFENIKRRGNVVDTAAYRYCIGQDVSYAEILMSVEAVDELQLAPVKQAEQLRSDSDIIDAIKASILEGSNTKMKLAETVAKSVGVSRAKAINIIEKYTGDNSSIHQWQFAVKERGAKVYILLDSTSTAEVSSEG